MSNGDIDANNAAQIGKRPIHEQLEYVRAAIFDSKDSKPFDPALVEAVEILSGTIETLKMSPSLKQSRNDR